MKPGEAFEALYNVVAKLRGPDGCPWDREQTPSTLRGHLIEECYECIEAIDEKNPAHICEELGDVYLLTTMLAFMHEEEQSEKKITVSDVLNGITEKLIRRHPHVFGELKVKNSAEVLDNWAKIKIEKEGRKSKNSILDKTGCGIPPLDRALKLQKKAAKAGFDWPNLSGVISKTQEELEEVREAALEAANQFTDEKQAPQKLEEELGDLLFSVVNLCRYLGADPSLALHRANGKFIKRFQYVEKKMNETGQPMEKWNLQAMDTFWDEAKKMACKSSI